MIIGVPKEIKEQEHRVGLVPASAFILTRRGHTVLVQKGAGRGSGYSDEEYVERRRGDRRDGAGCLRPRGDDRESEGAAAGRVRAAAEGADSVHLSASRGVEAADRSAA